MIEACPITEGVVDEHVARLNALLTLALLLFGLWVPVVWVFLFLDFCIRIKLTKCSPLAALNRWLLHSVLKVKPKFINKEPKIFAVWVGLVFSFLLVLSWLLSQTVLVWIILVIFGLATSLEAFLGYCIGCKTYQILVELKIIHLPQREA